MYESVPSKFWDCVAPGAHATAPPEMARLADVKPPDAAPKVRPGAGAWPVKEASGQHVGALAWTPQTQPAQPAAPAHSAQHSAAEATGAPSGYEGSRTRGSPASAPLTHEPAPHAACAALSSNVNIKEAVAMVIAVAFG